jgi:hypothetical protein
MEIEVKTYTMPNTICKGCRFQHSDESCGVTPCFKCVTKVEVAMATPSKFEAVSDNWHG